MDMTVDEFCDRKMAAAVERLNKWVEEHPNADVDEAEEELFEILMGKRDQ